MKTGVVKFFNEQKGFGFIIVDETKEEIFVHVSGLSDRYKPKKDDQVQFNTKEGKKGITAVNVELAA